jgi:enamine deaminase RidA (YjgF/YER057c/UK114 family)
MSEAVAIETLRRHALRSHRTPWPPRLASRVDKALGGLLYGGLADASAGAPIGSVPVPLLGAGAPVLDRWLGHGALTSGTNRHGVRWQHDADWLFGCVDVAETAGLEAAAGHAYAGVFDALRLSGFTHLLSVWNYLPRINEEGPAMERYKRFNAGRQQAFLDAGERAFEGAPAACAIGTAGGPLRVHFLAGQRAVRHVENPRQVSAYHYPQRYGPRAPTFSRAALAEAGDGRLGLFISGTASIVGHESVHLGDVRAQVRETVVNLQAVLDNARAQSSARWSLRDLHAVVYVRHARDHAAVVDELARVTPELGRDAGELVFLHADICRRELDVEIEGHAWAEGELV